MSEPKEPQDLEIENLSEDDLESVSGGIFLNQPDTGDTSGGTCNTSGGTCNTSGGTCNTTGGTCNTTGGKC